MSKIRPFKTVTKQFKKSKSGTLDPNGTKTVTGFGFYPITRSLNFDSMSTEDRIKIQTLYIDKVTLQFPRYLFNEGVFDPDTKRKKSGAYYRPWKYEKHGQTALGARLEGDYGYIDIMSEAIDPTSDIYSQIKNLTYLIFTNIGMYPILRKTIINNHISRCQILPYLDTEKKIWEYFWSQAQLHEFEIDYIFRDNLSRNIGLKLLNNVKGYLVHYSKDNTRNEDLRKSGVAVYNMKRKEKLQDKDIWKVEFRFYKSKKKGKCSKTWFNLEMLNGNLEEIMNLVKVQNYLREKVQLLDKQGITCNERFEELWSNRFEKVKKSEVRNRPPKPLINRITKLLGTTPSMSCMAVYESLSAVKKRYPSRYKYLDNLTEDMVKGIMKKL